MLGYQQFVTREFDVNKNNNNTYTNQRKKKAAVSFFVFSFIE
jgi:hypothetical protein